MQSSPESQKYGFALHTSSPELGLAMSNFANDTHCKTWDLGRDLSTHLHHYLPEFLLPQTWGDLAFIGVAKGPGSFTGTRIGVVTARTLAQQLDIPLFAISTLAAVAWSHQKQVYPQPLLHQGGGGQEAIALQMPAQRGQLFAAIYQSSSSDSGVTELFPDTVITPEAWQQTLDSWPTPYQLIDIPAGIGLGASVSSVLELAHIDWQQGKCPHWSDALPFYGQHPVDVK
ncbi:MAG TPA: tRNA (adenosine(37)-N6)-threonylcarbamoyltransferase complex dimerization subunit type 1 TsaB [Coleofasciculaceae cyanobacterium]|jgi:tRNA threonylcarbamoyl adenosine modification protein YeaZ